MARKSDQSTADISVIIPTYNEAKNLPQLVDEIATAFQTTDHRYEVVIVDDDSPDKTWKIAEELGTQYPVRVIRRTKESGLATAVVRGITKSTADKLVVMDGDGQHPPERILDLVNRLNANDIVIGSRFVEEGSVSDFGLIRRCMSWLANILAILCFPTLRSVKDLQSGFFAIRRSVVNDVTLRPIGYKILIEILVRGEYENLTEIGYEFEERKKGDSNISVRTVIKYLHHLIRLRLP